MRLLNSGERAFCKQLVNFGSAHFYFGDLVDEKLTDVGVTGSEYRPEQKNSIDLAVKILILMRQSFIRLLMIELLHCYANTVGKISFRRMSFVGFAVMVLFPAMSSDLNDNFLLQFLHSPFQPLCWY
ncbi:hypothetical protein [Flavihumibacter sp. UBA7668]|uniref:hypothetical protein n=1 Tax=Flavihumibacter sp. UBA7668 TaxID=1946542 RepID=UPI0025C28DDE|nr:hypothetical protein [Flavihumibacter sp. UBA7668]